MERDARLRERATFQTLPLNYDFKASDSGQVFLEKERQIHVLRGKYEVHRERGTRWEIEKDRFVRCGSFLTGTSKTGISRRLS